MIPQFKIKRGNIGSELYIIYPDFSEFPSTNSTDATTASSTTSLSVLNNSDFSANDYLFIESVGNESNELVKISSVSGSDTIVLTAAVSFNHPIDTVLTYIPYNQIEIYRSTDAGVNYSLLTTISIKLDDARQQQFYLHAAGASTDYYRIRYKNSTATTYSDYSDPLIATGYTDNSVFSIKKRALEAANQTIGDVITHEFLNEALWEGRREFDNSLKKWSFRQEFDYILANATPGARSIAVPTNLRNRNTAKNIYSIRIGNRENLDRITKSKWNEYYRDIHYSELSTAATDASITLVLDDSGDFDESGNVSVWNGSSEDVIAYTANAETTGTLSDVTGIDAGASYAVDTPIWQNATFSLPTEFTVFEGRIWFNYPIHGDYQNENIYIDFYKEIPAYDSDADTLDEPEYDGFVNYLSWRIKKRLNSGLIDLTDNDFVLWTSKKGTAVKNETLGYGLELIPDTSDLDG